MTIANDNEAIALSFIKEVDMNSYSKTSKGKVFHAHVTVKNLEKLSSKMVNSLTDTSWISELDAVSQISLSATVTGTIQKLVSCIKDQEADSITEEFGEYMISDTAQAALVECFQHAAIPIAELLKEKISGNPGFDFHTVANESLILFGEAKYSGSANKYKEALNQIQDFIEKKKCDAELILLEKLVKKDAIDNYINGSKGFIAAFSINSKNPENIICNAIKSSHIDAVLCHSELYLIGVSVDVK